MQETCKSMQVICTMSNFHRIAQQAQKCLFIAACSFSYNICFLFFKQLIFNWEIHTVYLHILNANTCQMLTMLALSLYFWLHHKTFSVKFFECAEHLPLKYMSTFPRILWSKHYSQWKKCRQARRNSISLQMMDFKCQENHSLPQTQSDICYIFVSDVYVVMPEHSTQYYTKRVLPHVTQKQKCDMLLNVTYFFIWFHLIWTLQ